MTSLVKSVGTIGGLTLVSRIFGFVRDMLLARVLGAGLAADAFQLAFTLPNTFRRLFAEGAFSVAFVPMYSRALHGAEDEKRGEDAAKIFTDCGVDLIMTGHVHVPFALPITMGDKCSYGVGAGLALGSRERLATFSIGGIAAPQNLLKAEQSLRDELERARRDGFTATEVADARQGLLQARLLERSEDAAVAGAWAWKLDLGRSFSFSQAFEARIAEATPEQVNAAFRKYIDPAKMTFVLAGDAKKGVK